MPGRYGYESRTLRARSNGWLLAAIWVLCHPADIRAETVTLVAALDATLIEHPAGGLANGSGPALFVGRTSQSRDPRRRGLVYFDVAGAVPPGASVERAELVLVLTPSNDALAEVTLHRVLSAWSEGASSAGGGGGAPAVVGDATWLHAEYDSRLWSTPGGDFAFDPSASAQVGAVGVYVWSSTPRLAADVQGWLDDAASNHGWLLIGDETAPTTAKRFASREAPEADARPMLIVEYRLGCEAAGLEPGASGLCQAYCEALDCDGPHPRGSERACGRLAHNFARRTGGAPLPCE